MFYKKYDKLQQQLTTLAKNIVCRHIEKSMYKM